MNAKKLKRKQIIQQAKLCLLDMLSQLAYAAV